MTRIRNAAMFVIPPLLCLILFWRVPITWFMKDDFAWLRLPLGVNHPSDIWSALFTPRAQGTVRVLSDRLFFLTFSSWFGLHALPYRIWVLATWFADLTLASLVGARLAGSRAAGFWAAVFWTASYAVVEPLMWASAYNQILCAFFLLAAFYSRLRRMETGERKWIAGEWVAYLAGFGALESMVMYPAIALLHSLCMARKRVRSTFALFLPAIAFTILHTFFVPRSTTPYYQVIVDRRLPQNFLKYLAWSLGPMQLGEWTRHGRRVGFAVTALVGVALAIFVLSRLRRREYGAIFCCGWFVLLIAPVLPLPNHVTDYYTAIPVLGLAWLGGWAFVAAWQSGGALRAGGVILAAAFIFGSSIEINGYSKWIYALTMRMKTMLLGVGDAGRSHPGVAILLEGIDNDMFSNGVENEPFELVGLRKVFLAPGGEKKVKVREDIGGVTRWVISPAAALDLIDHGQARVEHVESGGLQDITVNYAAKLRADPRSTLRDYVDVGDPAYADFAGPEWFRIVDGVRWMPKRATVKLSGPIAAAQRLYVTGYSPPAAMATGPVTLYLSGDGTDLGSVVVRDTGMFAVDFALPVRLVGTKTIVVTIEVSKVLHTAGDDRDLGLIFGTFGIH